MSWSLAISNGDISYGPKGLNTVTGANKLVQDLSCCILEPLGTDYNDPNFGSIIEGGIDADGNVYHGLIGSNNDQDVAAMIQAEIQRICQNYQMLQVQRNQNDLSTYGSSTLTAGEALLGVSNINIQQVETMVHMTATLTTGSGTSLLTSSVGG
jgi:hypothetical protein